MDSSRKKPAAVFEIRLVGPGLKPWGVPMRVLTRALNAVQRLMEHVDEEPDDRARRAPEAELEDAPLHLIGVVSRSAGYAVAARDPSHVLSILSDFGQGIEAPDGEWGPDILYPVEDLSAIARALSCSIEFKKPGPKGDVLARVEPDSYTHMADSAFVVGRSSVYAYLERVGGTTERRCALRLPNQPRKMVYCTVAGEDLVRELGQHIYENVMVSGTVTWFRKNMTVRRIHVTSFESQKKGSILEALNRVYEAGGKAWDEVDDPEAVIAEMRGE